MSDVFDKREHSCGCRTHFDLVSFRSVATVRCAEHESPIRNAKPDAADA